MSRSRMVIDIRLILCHSKAVLLGEKAAVRHSFGSNQTVCTRGKLNREVIFLPFTLAEVEGCVDAVPQQSNTPVLEINPLGIITGLDGEGENLALFGLFHIVERSLAPVLDRMGLRIDARGDSQGAANSGEENFLGEVRAEAHLQQCSWNSN